MITGSDFAQIALSFEQSVEMPHFTKTSFRVNNKIFATLDVKTGKAVVKLSEIEQSVFCQYDRTVMYPVNGTWGKQGWTVIDLATVSKEILTDALTSSYCNVAPAKYANLYKQF